MKYLGNVDNVLRAAALSMTNGVPSNAVYRTDEAAKLGSGRVVLSGSYSGAADATFDVEVLDTTITGTPRLSQPIFRGIGNGEITALAATAAVPAQIITISLADLGTQTRAAYVPFQNVTLRAKTTGPGGNNLTVTIDNTGLIKTATPFSLTSPLVAQMNEYIGDEWNFGHSALQPDGTLRSDTPRLAFGEGTQVYRAYKRYENGRYMYSFSPTPVRDVALGEQVFAVAGSRTVTITNGIVTETYSGIVTLYDLLSRITATSALVEVVGVVANDLHPNGMGIDDLSVQTASYIDRVIKEGTRYAKRAALGLTVAAHAPTEHVVIECIEAVTPNAERWSVSGTVSGDLADAITGVLYAHTPLGFTIPEGVLPATTPAGDIVGEFRPISRPEGTPTPCLNLFRPVLGATARDKTLTFVYTLRPRSGCDCDAEPVDGGPNADCLGITELGGDMSTLADGHRLRRERVRAWVNGWVETSRRLTGTGPSQQISTETGDLRVARSVTDLLLKTLDSLYTHPDARLRNTAWQASHLYEADDIREPVIANGYRYRVALVTGNTAATEPTWPTTIGATVTDGSVTWENIGKTPIPLFDQKFADITAEFLKFIEGPTATRWFPMTTGGVFALPRVLPTVRNGHSYVVVKTPPLLAGNSGATEPAWPTNGSTVVDGDLVYQDDGAYWIGSHVYGAGSLLKPYNGRIFKTTSGGTSGSTEPDWDANVVTDGSITWVSQNNPVLLISINSPETSYPGGWSQLVSEYAGTFAEEMDVVLAAAGIETSFSSASTPGSECWQDHPERDFYWVCQEEPYQPVFTNLYYHTAKRQFDALGELIVVDTHEAGFAFQGCESELLPGDTMVVTIKAAENSRYIYQQGDRFEFDVIRGAPLTFGGGQNGSDTLTWRVRGSASGAAGTFAPYLLNTLVPNTYTDNGLTFAIGLGGIDFVLGDTFTFAIEGGRCRWRKNGGAWSATPIAIQPTVVLSDGLSANFIGGNAPSWVPTDRWSFAADAINGADQLRQPTDPRAAWMGSTELVVTPSVPSAIQSLLLCDHAIPSMAIIRLQGSNDDFITTPLNVVIPWFDQHIYYELSGTQTFAKYRVRIDQSGSMQWVYLGLAFQPTLPSGRVELGKLAKKWKLPGLNARKALGVTVQHTALADAQAKALVALIAHACEFDDRRIAVVPNPAEPSEMALVEYAADSIDVTDEFDFQPSDVAHRLTAISLTLEPVA